ncbi:SH3 domain-containing protein [Nitrospinaceae bacterium]|nr:SH3 domain-containing protein [Nitrospinaceae bacterium]
MRLLSKLFLITLTRRLILIGLFALVLSGNLVFAQDFKQSIESEVEGKGYILVVTKGNPLNVRQKASSFSPMVGSLPNGSQVPFTGITANDAVNGNRFWYQVEYLKGKLGWVSGDYSKKIEIPKKPAASQVTKLDSKNEVPIAKTKTENPENFLRSTDIVKKPAVENKKDSTPVESQGFFKKLFSSKPKQTSNKPSQKETATSEKPLANIDGFRSAKFGMGRAEVTKAIFNDFGIASGKITIINHPTELTQSLAITVEQLIPRFGKSKVVYVFGYRSNKLMQVNIFLGHEVDKRLTSQQVVDLGNILGNHFFKKRFQEDGLVVNANLNDGSILIFRGKDQKGRMALLRLLNTQQNNKNNEVKISLNLSYIEKPGQADTFQLNKGDF